MASADLCSLNVPFDNFGFLDLPSLPFPLGSGDLNLMARTSGLLDEPSQTPTVDTYPACQSYPVHSVPQTECPGTQAQQLLHVQPQVANVCPVSASDYACQSQSIIPQPDLPQPIVPQPGANRQTNPQQIPFTASSAKPSDMPPQRLADIGTPTQVLVCCCKALPCVLEGYLYCRNTSLSAILSGAHCILMRAQQMGHQSSKGSDFCESCDLLNKTGMCAAVYANTVCSGQQPFV